MLPARQHYNGDQFEPFRIFQLRKRCELDALKLYLLFVARRDRKTNMAHLNYEQIHERSGVRQNDIRQAISVLINANLIVVESLPNPRESGTYAHAYRLTNLLPRQHMGTIGRHDPHALTAE